MAALESQPLLGFMLKTDALQKMQFKLYHKNTLYYIFKADDAQTAKRYGTKCEATLHIVMRKITFSFFLVQMDRIVQGSYCALTAYVMI